MPETTASQSPADGSIQSNAYKPCLHPKSADRPAHIADRFRRQPSSIKKAPGAFRTLTNWAGLESSYIVRRAETGRVLLVGEGNLSFTTSLVFDHGIDANMLTATTFEGVRALPDTAKRNADTLSKLGVRVMHGVDATRIDKTLGDDLFDTIIFQFPNVGSREPKYWHNPNFVLLRRFLRCARSHLSGDGEIIVSTVKSSYYDGMFRIDEAASFASLAVSFAVPFSPGDFPSYTHVNTNDDDSALSAHDTFKTWIFKPL